MPSGIWVLDIDDLEGEASLRPSRRNTEPFRKRVCRSLLVAAMCGLHAMSQFRRASAGSVPALMCAVMAVT